MKRTEIEDKLIDLWHICGKSYLHKLRHKQLNRYVRNDVSRSETPLSTETGNGFAADDLSESRAMAAATLSDDSDANVCDVVTFGISSPDEFLVYSPR